MTFLLVVIWGLQVGNLLAAKDDLASAAQLQPNNTDILELKQHVEEVEALSFRPAMYQLNRGEFADALPTLRKVIDAAEAAGALSVAAHGYSYMGIALSQQGKISEAIVAHERHLHLAEGLASTAERVRALSNISSVYQLKGDHLRALEYHTQQAQLVTDDTPRQDMCALYGNMGRAYQAAGQLQTALEYHGKCLHIATELDHDLWRAKALGNLGQTLSALGRDDEALAAHRKSLLLSQQAEDELACAQQLEAIAMLQQSQGDHQRALRSFDRALVVLGKHSGMSRQIARVRGGKAMSLHALGDSQAAAELLNCHAAAAREAGDDEEEACVLQRLGLLHMERGDADKAVLCHTRQLKLRRDITGGDSSVASSANTTHTVPKPDSARAGEGGAGRGSAVGMQEDHAPGGSGVTNSDASATTNIKCSSGSNTNGCGDEHSGTRNRRDAATRSAGSENEAEASMALAAALSVAGRHREAHFHYTAALRKAQKVVLRVCICARGTHRARRSALAHADKGRTPTQLPRCLRGFWVTVGGLCAQERDALTQGVVMVSIGVVLLQDGRESLAAAAFQQVLP